MKNFVFTSESVTDGHPDKMCDIISDAIVDHLLKQDPRALVRAECAVASALMFISARFGTNADIDLTRVARKVIQQIGYDQPDFNATTCSILTAPQALPPDPARQFDEHALTNQEIARIAVRNQVTVFGFACNQTPSLMPLPILLAHALARRLSIVRRQKNLPYLMPDGKVQVGVEYREKQPYRLHGVTVIASQKGAESVSLGRLRSEVREAVIEPVFEGQGLGPDAKTRIFVNPEGLFLGGPVHHSGLTGRKNDVDTYGAYARQSGNALSGKDPFRVDRVGAYAARHAAKNVVAAGLAKQCEVFLSYSIRLTKPVGIAVRTAGTGKIPNDEITKLVRKHFDFRIAGILRDFSLRHLPTQHPEGFFQKLAAFGHVGREDLDLPWERIDKAPLLAKG
jgi:S-adenosylmethionine synthetase